MEREVRAGRSGRFGHRGNIPHPALRLALSMMAGGLAALFALQLVPPARGAVGPGTVEIEGSLGGGGRTQLRVPPLGSVSADTHDTPLEVFGRVEVLDLDRVEELLGEADPADALYAGAEDDIRALVRKFSLRLLVAGFLVGAVAGALVSRLRPWLVASGALGGVLAVAVLLVVTWRGFDATAFAEPAFEGPIERAPEVIDTARRHAVGFAEVRERVEVLAAEVSELYALAARPGLGREPGPGETRILHVSDLHLNPVGVEVAKQLASTFEVAAILDTGDTTTFGLPLEAELGRAISDAGRRWLFVPGNHDSDDNRQALAEIENVEVLDNQVVEVGGVRILGIADPTFTADNETSTREATAAKRAAAPGVARRARAVRPHVLAVHDPTQADRASGAAPLVVAGHLHDRRARARDGTVTLVVGSTGATGLGSFTVEDSIPYEAQVLHFRQGCLVAVDYVILEGIGGDFQLDRQAYDFVRSSGTLACVPADDESGT